MSYDVLNPALTLFNQDCPFKHNRTASFGLLYSLSSTACCSWGGKPLFFISQSEKDVCNAHVSWRCSMRYGNVLVVFHGTYSILWLENMVL